MRTTRPQRDDMQRVVNRLRFLPAVCADMDFAQLYERDVEALVSDLEEVEDEIARLVRDLRDEDLEQEELCNALLNLLDLLDPR